LRPKLEEINEKFLIPLKSGKCAQNKFNLNLLIHRVSARQQENVQQQHLNRKQQHQQQ
jgi:hypothetical protein